MGGLATSFLVWSSVQVYIPVVMGASTSEAPVSSSVCWDLRRSAASSLVILVILVISLLELVLLGSEEYLLGDRDLSLCFDGGSLSVLWCLEVAVCVVVISSGSVRRGSLSDVYGCCCFGYAVGSRLAFG